MPHRLAFLALAALPVQGAAQAWDDASARSLAERAAAVRATTIADSTLVSWSARAHGVVTFEAEVAGGLLPTPRLVKGDELLVEVYWERPDRSKQVIRGWRDSTFLPTDLSYHRDHLGIVSNDFGDLIRIGEGDEVADVVHPLSAAGLRMYQYRIRDTVRIRAGGTGPIVLVALEVRPVDRARPAVIGTLFLDAGQVAVVRSELSFTPAAYRDRDLEDITIRLERSLVEGRHWLPYLQQVEIRRRSAVIDLPLRGVIRGRWEIGDYVINDSVPAIARLGPPIGGLIRPTPTAVDWPGSLMAALDTATAADPDQLADLRRAAGRVIGRRLLGGLPPVQLGVSRFSELLRVNRVEGLRLGAGFGWQGGPVDRAELRAGLGTGDSRLTGSLRLARTFGATELSVRGARLVRDVGYPAGSELVNSLLAQEGGRDRGDYVLQSEVAVGLEQRLSPGTLLGIELAREWAESVGVAAEPARGRYRPNPALGGKPYWVGRLGIGAERGNRPERRWRAQLSGEVGLGSGRGYGRIGVDGDGAISVAGGVFEVRGAAAVMTDSAPVRRGIAFGGVGTVPGEAFRGYGGRRGVWVAVGWLKRLPGPSIGLGPYGRTRGTMWVGPFVAAGGADGEFAGMPWRESRGLRPAVGMAAELFDRNVRIELGHRLRGSGATLSIDVARVWWPIL